MPPLNLTFSHSGGKQWQLGVSVDVAHVSKT